MGTVISLSVSDLEITWSKNSLGIDHGGLFQSHDHYTEFPTEDDMKEGEVFINDPERILYRTVLRRSLGTIYRRLELLGFTLENARVECELMVKEMIGYRKPLVEESPELFE